MIVVTGATGTLGGMVVERLLEQLPADQLAVAVRDPAKAERLAERGVQVRRGDYDDTDALVEAFSGADRLLMVSAPRLGDELLAAHRSAIDAAKRAGVGRLFYTSHIGSDPLSPFGPMAGHAATETMLRDSGLPFTVLRNGFYTATPEEQARTARDSGELRLPADAPVSWTTHEDLAAGTAALLLDDDLTERVVGLTADEAIDAGGLATLVAAASGRPVERVVVPDDEYRAGLVAAGVPEFGASMTTGLWAATRQHRFGIVDPTLTALLGRPTVSQREVVERALADPHPVSVTAVPTSSAERVRERIVEAAAALLREGGADAVSTRAVSTAAGVQAPTLYRLFGDKQGLLDAVATHALTTYVAEKANRAPGPDPVDDLRAGWDLHVAFGLAHPAAYVLAYGGPDPTRRVPPAAAAGMKILAELVHRIAEAGRLRVTEERAVQLVHAAGSGTTLSLLARPADHRDLGLSTLAREAVVAAVTTDTPAVADPGPAAAAIALRSVLPQADALTGAERRLLHEWLDRIAGADRT